MHSGRGPWNPYTRGRADGRDGLRVVRLIVLIILAPDKPIGIQHVAPPVLGEHPTWLAPSVEGKELFIGVASVVQWRPAEPPAEAKTDNAVVLLKPVGEHGSFGFAVRALVRPGSDP